MATDDDFGERQRLYERTRDSLDAIGRSISESYDRALLTLSSAFLGGSLALTNQVVELKTATAKPMLYVAWAFFALAIMLTLSSFVYGLLTLQPLRDAAERYYMKKEPDAWQVSYSVQRGVLRYVVACGVTFGLGITLLGIFIGVNVSKESIVSQPNVSKEAIVSQKPASPKWDQRSTPPGTFQKPVAPAQPGTGGGTQQAATPASNSQKAGK